MHTTWSSQATVINLQSGEGFVENLQPVFLVRPMSLLWYTPGPSSYYALSFVESLQPVFLVRPRSLLWYAPGPCYVTPLLPFTTSVGPRPLFPLWYAPGPSPSPGMLHLPRPVVSMCGRAALVQVHGFMMFMAFGILVPFGVLAARYLKTRDWYQ